MPGCSGKCCSVFNFPIAPAEMRVRQQPEDTFLADMLIGLTAAEAQERAERFDVTPPEGYSLESWATETAGTLYTCRHWDEETRLCGAYESRPTMCADYPYGRQCQHDCACTERGAESRGLEPQCDEHPDR